MCNIITTQQIQFKAKINVNVIFTFSLKGVLNIDPGTMADYMMEAIAEFSRRNKTTCVELVRVVIFQKEMVPTYLRQMEKASKPGSSFFDMVKAPFKSFGRAIKGTFVTSYKFETLSFH